MATTLAGLQRGALPTIGMPPVVQFFPRDYSAKVNDAEGGVSRAGFMTYEVLWTRVDVQQLAVFQRIFAATVGSDLYFTGRWWDTNNPVVRWVDMMGKPDATDPTPNVPAFAYGIQVFSTVSLKLNNVILVNDPAIYS